MVRIYVLVPLPILAEQTSVLLGLIQTISTQDILRATSEQVSNPRAQGYNWVKHVDLSDFGFCDSNPQGNFADLHRDDSCIFDNLGIEVSSQVLRFSRWPTPANML